MTQSHLSESTRAPSTLATPSEAPSLAAPSAFAAIEQELADLPLEQLVRPTVDVARAAATALAAVPRLRELRAELVAWIPAFPIHKLDRLETYALAAWYADSCASDPGAAARALAAEGAPLRAELRVAAEALADRGLVSTLAIAGAGAGTGHLAVAKGLLKLGSVLLEAWPEIEGRTALTRARAERACTLATQLLVAVGERDRTDRPEVLARQRAFTLMMDAYESCRRAVFALRWREGDVDEVAPSLFASRGRRRSRARVDEPPPAPASKPA